jgi:hypothetical protein
LVSSSNIPHGRSEVCSRYQYTYFGFGASMLKSESDKAGNGTVLIVTVGIRKFWLIQKKILNPIYQCMMVPCLMGVQHTYISSKSEGAVNKNFF